MKAKRSDNSCVMKRNGRLCIIRGLLLFAFIFYVGYIDVSANNIRISGKPEVKGFIGNDTAIVELNLSWDNSWRDDFNWDAAWIFLKYKERGASGAWHHAYLLREGHQAETLSGNEGGNYTFMFGEAGSGANAKVTGVFLMRDKISEGKVNVRLRLKWIIGGNSQNPLNISDFGSDLDAVYVAVHAIEMVYLPYGAYYLGDGFSNSSLQNKTEDASLSSPEFCMIDREDELALAESGGSWSGILGANYPKGYAGCYVMKYEVSQEEYVEFLNSLTLVQQKAHVSNNNFEQMKRGEYVFGDLSVPNCRNGIVFIEQKVQNGPAVFGNNLNPANDFFSLDDGQTLACNYMSPYDMLAYCDWSGLRPMSELEYEKACRRPYPQIPDKGEYAWNSNSGVSALNGLTDLVYLGDEREQATNSARNVNSGGYLNGPVRCGLFATSGSNQSQSGATYWGVMEMSGNLWEMCYNVRTEGGKFVANNFDYSHGDGELNVTGATDITAAYWPAVVDAIGVRGGSFSTADSLLRTSDRTFANGNYFTALTQRDSTVGFRAIRGVLNTTGFDGGGIVLHNGSNVDTTCVGAEVELTGVLPHNSVGKLSYVWYMSEDNGTSWKLLQGETGENLRYDGWVNTTATYNLYKFRRKVTCAVGEAETEASLYVMPLPWTINYEEFANASGGVQVTSVLGTSFYGNWQLSGAPSTLSVSDYGSISGITPDLLVNFQVKVTPEKCPDVSFEKEIALTRVFAYTGGQQSILLAPGKYKVECWGARGGYSRRNGSLYRVSGLGGYTKGEIHLTNTLSVFAYVGGQGADAVVRKNSAGGYNGGGSGTWDNNDDESAGGGGGASDIRLVGGVWNDFASLKSRVMVAGGGGGMSWSWAVGSGGGLNAVGGNGLAYSGKQTSGYAFGVGQNASGVGNSDGVGGGGGGYYGGYIRNAKNVSSGGGGSSFISGYNGCDAISASSVISSIIHTGQPNHYSGFLFSNSVMIDGEGYQWTTVRDAKTGMPNLIGTGMMTGNTGNGQVKITPLP